MFTNDSVLANGPTFTDGFMSANPECKNGRRRRPSTWSGACARPAAATAPRTSTASSPQYSTAAVPGRHVGGVHRLPRLPLLRLDADHLRGRGTMRVWNKVGQRRRVAPPIAPAGWEQPACGSTTDLNSAAGATVAVPDNMVIQVSPDDTASRTRAATPGRSAARLVDAAARHVHEGDRRGEAAANDARPTRTTDHAGGDEVLPGGQPLRGGHRQGSRHARRGAVRRSSPATSCWPVASAAPTWSGSSRRTPSRCSTRG